MSRLRSLRQQFPLFIGAVIISLFGAAISGWIMNIVAIVKHLSDPVTGMFVFRCIGVAVAPLGAVLGWL